MPNTDTATKLLDSAQRLVQQRGFNAFSYADLAEEIGIRSASIHYHFKSKKDLGEALLGRYLEGLDEHLAKLEHEASGAQQRLALLIDGYRCTGCSGFMCLCGSLASDFETLPPEMQNLIGDYLSRTESWVRDQIEMGVRTSELSPIATADDLAAMLVSGLQGALLIGRSRGSSSPVDQLERAFTASLGVNLM